MSRVEFPGEISARRLQDLVRPAQFPDLALQLGDLLLIVARRAGPLPGIDFGFLHPVAESLGVYAQPMTDPAIEPRALPVSARSSKTIATARSRSSAGCAFRDAMSPNFPRGHGLQETRGGPSCGSRRACREIRGRLLGPDPAHSSGFSGPAGSAHIVPSLPPVGDAIGARQGVLPCEGLSDGLSGQSSFPFVSAAPVIGHFAAYRCRRCPGGRPCPGRCLWTVWPWRPGPPHPARRSPPPGR